MKKATAYASLAVLAVLLIASTQVVASSSHGPRRLARSTIAPYAGYSGGQGLNTRHSFVIVRCNGQDSLSFGGHIHKSNLPNATLFIFYRLDGGPSTNTLVNRTMNVVGNGNFHYAFQSPVSNGTHSVVIEVRDGSGNLLFVNSAASADDATGTSVFCP